MNTIFLQLSELNMGNITLSEIGSLNYALKASSEGVEGLTDFFFLSYNNHDNPCTFSIGIIHVSEDILIN